MNQHFAFAQRIRIRVFLEGIEIPVIAAQVDAAPNSPAMCTLQVPPLVEGTALKPRTLVHVFFLDSYGNNNPHVLNEPQKGVGAGPVDPDADTVNQLKRATDPTLALVAPCGDTRPKEWTNARYKLLFGGELMGFTWTKNALSRSLVLQCADWSNYIDYAYQWNNTDIFGPGLKALFSGGATNLFTDFMESEGSVVAKIVLSGRCNSFPKMRGMAAGIIRLIEAIGGSYYSGVGGSSGAQDNRPKVFRGQNVFFSLAELRLHFTQLFHVYEADPTSRNLLARNGYDGLFGRTLQGLGAQVSIRKAIEAVSRVIFHEMYPQPCPFYKKGTGNTPAGTRRVSIADDPELAVYAAFASTSIFHLQVAQTDFATATDVLTNASAAKAPSKRLAVAYKLANPLLDANNDAVNNALKSIDASITTVKRLRSQTQEKLTQLGAIRTAPPLLKTVLATVTRDLGALAVAMGNPAARKTGGKASTKVTTAFERVLTQLRRVPHMTYNTLKDAERVPPRLVQTILRPDVWFSAPPRCNVLFPDMYESISYQRQFMAEPTRFLLKTNDELFGEDMLFDKFYFAPATGSLKKDTARIQTLLNNDILDHELFTGILPVFEKMGEFNVHASRSSDIKAGAVPKAGYAQRAANFLYFKHRFNARQFHISGLFHPYVAVGFPGLLIDKWIDQVAAGRIRTMRETYQAADPSARALLLPKYSAELLGANFLGNFVSVSHQLSQEAMRGHTTIQCQYARQPSEGIEMLGIAERVQTVRRRMEGDAQRSTDVVSATAPFVGGIGPNQGVITSVIDVTEQYVDTSAAYFEGELVSDRTYGDKNGQALPVYENGRMLDSYARVGVPASFTGKGPVLYRAYTIKEDVPRYRRERIDIPSEEMLRPGWYGACWSNKHISEVYMDFFGTGSIVEPTKVLNAGGIERTRDVAQTDNSQDMDYAVDDLEIVVSLQDEATIEQAVEFLNVTYSFVKHAGVDANEFIKSYVWRPIATMNDIFGSDGLTFSADGAEVTSEGEVEGFHSRAFGPYNNALGLLPSEVQSMFGFERGNSSIAKADTRKEKHDAVMAYISKLSFSRAGVG